tara:strand:- start:508 stop:1167 length:660 start_codon:yes stop_codon:yes gene_type:complete
MKNIKKVKNKEADSFYLRNFKYFNENFLDEKIVNLIKNNNLRAENLLEIGCVNGYKLNQYSKLLKSKKSYGVDLSKKSIRDGKRKYKNLKLLNISSLQINRIKIKFDLIICGFFLYQLDRELIFNQFDLIFNKIKEKGFLLIIDFDPLFKHTNKDFNAKDLMSYKMSYDNFLVESGLFEIVSKIKYKTNSKDKRKFKSDQISLTLFRKINFQNSYPENI